MFVDRQWQPAWYSCYYLRHIEERTKSVARCSVCDHADRGLIDLALAADQVGNPELGKKFGVSGYAMRRHKLNHLPDTLKRGAELAEDLTAASVLKRIQDLAERTNALLMKAEAANDLTAAGKLIRESRENLVTLGRVVALFPKEGSTTNIDARSIHLGLSGLTSDELRKLIATVEPKRLSPADD